MSRPVPRRPVRRARPRLPRSLAAAGLIALSAAAPPAGAQPEPVERAPEAGAEFTPADRQRCAAIRAANQQLVRLAEGALKFTPTPDVLVFAHQLREDQRRLGEGLAQFAPRSMPAPGPAAPLEGSVDERFDREFLERAAAELEDTLALLAATVKEAEAPALRAFATEAIVVFDRNLHSIRALRTGG